MGSDGSSSARFVPWASQALALLGAMVCTKFGLAYLEVADGASARAPMLESLARRLLSDHRRALALLVLLVFSFLAGRWILSMLVRSLRLSVEMTLLLIAAACVLFGTILILA